MMPIFVLFAVSFILNLFWEVLQVPLYEGFHYTLGGFGILIWASSGDAVYIALVAMFSFGTRLNRLFKVDKWLVLRSIFFASFLFISSYRVELRGLSNGWWSYAEAMPIVFGVGLSPMLELFVTGVTSLLLLKKAPLLRKISNI